MHSHHSHSGAFCSHACQDTTPSSMLHKAYSLGFKSYCLSEHIPRSKKSQLYPEEVEDDVTPKLLEARFEEYLEEAQRSCQIWRVGEGKDMQVLIGAELENVDENCIDYIEKVFNGRTASSSELRGNKAGLGRIDYLIGSVHHVNSIPIDFDKVTFEQALDSFRQKDDKEVDAEIQQRRAHLRLIIRYLDLQMELLNHFQPEIIGHFDLCRLYEPDMPMTVSDSSTEADAVCLSLLQSVDDRVQRNIKYICSYGGLIEINSASTRKGWKTPYPGQDILDVIISLGGKLCLSDDAHSHEQVGLNYHKAKEYLERNGVKSIWKLQKASSVSLGFPRGTMAVEVVDWGKDNFWSTPLT